MIAEIAVGVAALGAIAWVVRPLLREPAAERHGSPVTDAAARKERALEAILDLEAELAAGKLSEEDFVTFKTRYEHEALAAMRELDIASAAEHDSLEAEIAAVRARLR